MTRNESELQLRQAVLDAYRAEQAEPIAVQRAYLRFSWRRRKNTLAPRVFGWVLSGMVLGLGAASAATLLPLPKAPWAMPVGSTKFMAPVAKKAQVGVAPKSAVNSEPPPPASLLTSAPSAVAPRAAALRGPALAAGTSASDWQRAATALRTGELGVAEAALEKLEKSDNPLDRQAAELARAQLLVKRGMRAEATPTLQRLAREGGSEVIRSQATSVLQSMSPQ
jgi:hypothetical protein